jgi:hypothetical protein
MQKLLRMLLLALLVLATGSAVLLATWDLPAPTVRVERRLSDDQLPR